MKPCHIMYIPGKHRKGNAVCVQVEPWWIAYHEAALLFSLVDRNWMLGDLRKLREIQGCCPGRVLVGPFVPCKTPALPRYQHTLELSQVVLSDRKGVKTDDQDPLRSV